MRVLKLERKLQVASLVMLWVKSNRNRNRS